MNPRQPSSWQQLRLYGGPALYEQLLVLALEYPGVGVISEGDEILVVFPPDVDAPKVLERVRELLEWMIESDLAEQQRFALDPLPDEDWVARWRASLGPVRAGEHLVILPPGVEAEFLPGDIALTLEPRMAFGTGDHATTQLALELLEPIAPNSAHVLDLGCGNGVLSIASALLGAKQVTAIDNEEEAYDETLENTASHDVSDRITVIRGDAISFTPDAPVDLLLANIFVNPILSGLDGWMTSLADNAILILTGVLEGEEEQRLLTGCAQHGLVLDKLLRKAGWIAARFRHGSA